MLGAGRPGRGETERPGLRLGERDQLADVLDRQARVRGDDERRHRDQRDRREIALGVVGDFRVDVVVDRDLRRRAHEERVAVGRRFCHQVGAYHPARADAVLDHHRLAPMLAHLLADRARDEIGAPAGGERHDDADRFGGIRLCEDCGGPQGERDQAGAAFHRFVSGDPQDSGIVCIRLLFGYVSGA